MSSRDPLSHSALAAVSAGTQSSSARTVPPSAVDVYTNNAHAAANASASSKTTTSIISLAARFPAGLLLPIAILAIWEIASRLGWVAPHLLPPPSALAQTAWSLIQDGSLFKHIGVSSARVGAGFVIGGSLGLLIGALVALNRRAESLLDPSFQALRAVPSLAWVPLLLLWLGIDLAPKLTLIAIGTFFPMYLATVSGLRNVDRKLVEVGVQLGFSRGTLLKRIYIPAALPTIMTGLRASLGLGWMFLVAAELIAATSGLGYLLTDGRETGRADLVMVSIITLALLGKASDAVLVAIEKRVLQWRDVANLQSR